VTNLFDKLYLTFDHAGLGYRRTNAKPLAPREWCLTLAKRF